MDSSPLLTVAIPTWNNKSQLQTTLDTLLCNTEFPFEVLVVDNGCDPSIARSAKDWPKRLRYCTPGRNAGWMGGLNFALEQCTTPYFAMMNDDVVFPANALPFWRILLKQFEDESVGMVGPTSDFISGPQNICHSLPDVHDTTYAIGVCLVLPTDLLREIGGLDETLPGGDDLDLTIRVRKAGKKVRIARQAFLHHIGQQSGPRKQGKYYDSEEHQELVKNAIIRKHGFAWMHETWQGQVHAVEVPEGSGDHEWISEQLADDLHGIDVGCGDKILGPNSTGYDARPKDAVGAGGQRNATVHPDALYAEATELPVEDNSQDYVIASHLLEHLVSPLEALEEWHRVLKPGGTLVMCLPDHDELDTMLIDHTHLHAFTQESLWRLLNCTRLFRDITVQKGPYGSLQAKAVAE